jgi:hypothetical protein
MLKRFFLIILSLILIVSTFAFIGCSSDDEIVQPDATNALKLRPLYLPSLKQDDSLIYEMWVANITVVREVVYMDEVASLGQFFWDAENAEFLSKWEFPRREDDVFNLPEGKVADDYDLMFITIEPYEDDDPEMSMNGILQGAIILDYPELAMTFSGGFDEASGAYVLASLTDHDLEENEGAGIWFTFAEAGNDFSYENLELGLEELPIIPEDADYIYEAWVYMDRWSKPLSLGKFRNALFRDLDNPYVDNKYAPLLPGEDFLRNAPRGFEFPLNLVGNKGDSTAVYITIEPYPDPDPKNPFPIICMSRNLPLLSGPSADTSKLYHQTMELGNRYSTMPKVEVVRTAAVED